jgi:hypothetical protein
VRSLEIGESDRLVSVDLLMFKVVNLAEDRPKTNAVNYSKL